MWNADKKNGLDHLIFPQLAVSCKFEGHFDFEMREILNEIKDEKVHVFTLEQGTQDWFKARQFSVTSSQSDAAFRKAMILHQDSKDWHDVARYLEGDNYKTREFIYFILFY